MRLNGVNLKDLKNKLCGKCVQTRTDFYGFVRLFELKLSNNFSGLRLKA